MSFLAKLFIDDQVFTVLHTDLEFHQPTDFTNKPSALPQGGLFSISTEATDNIDLLRLATAVDTTCEGYLRIYKHDGLSRLMDYEFFDTYVVSHRTDFTNSGAFPLTDFVVFSPGILRIGDMIFEKPWKVTDLARKDANKKKAREPEKKPAIVDIYYEDRQGNLIDKNHLEIDETVVLVLKTTDAVGKKISVDLGDNKRNFEYKGKVLNNDVLEGITVKSNLQKFRLKVVEQN